MVNLSANRNCPVQSDSSSQPVDFLQLLPRIRHHARKAFRNLNPEAREEAVQDVVANCFATYRRLIERGKTQAIAASPLARYAVAQTRAGRQVGGQLNIHDVSSRYCQLNRGVAMESLERVDKATGAWEQILVEDHSSTPADIVAIRIDFQTWLTSLSHRQRQIAELLSTGESTQAVAKLFRVSCGRISQFRSQLKATWEAFQGERETALLASA